MVGTTTLVPAGAGVGKRGRGAGFYCEACDLTFKDNLQWIEHTNSMQHQRATGRTGQVKKATAAEVHARIEILWAKVEEMKKEQVTSLQERLEVRREEDEKERSSRASSRAQAGRRLRPEQTSGGRERSTSTAPSM